MNMKKKTVLKSAVTGRFVNKGYAKGHPDKTFRETVKSSRKRRK